MISLTRIELLSDVKLLVKHFSGKKYGKNPVINLVNSATSFNLGLFGTIKK